MLLRTTITGRLYIGLCNLLAQRVLKAFLNRLLIVFNQIVKTDFMIHHQKVVIVSIKYTLSTKTTRKVCVEELHKNWSPLLEKCKLATILDYNGRISQFSKHSLKGE